jgi:hypothetical protein
MSPKPVYWKPKYGTRSSRHKAWVRREARREAALNAEPRASLRDRMRSLFRR